LDSIAENEVRLGHIQKRTAEIDKRLNEIFAKEAVSYFIPDRVPPDWGKSKIKVSLPIDMLEVKYLAEIVGKSSEIIMERKKLRDEEASLLLSMGRIKIEETVPE